MASFSTRVSVPYKARVSADVIGSIFIIVINHQSYSSMIGIIDGW